MGLDMYAHRRLYVKKWSFDDSKEQYDVQITKGGKKVDGIQFDCISSVDEEVMYWRKANHIHRWFVENAQHGEDDCEDYMVEITHLEKLLRCCKEVIEASQLVKGTIHGGIVYDSNHPNGVTRRVPGKLIKDATIAHKLLPTTDGFFFGCTEYDEDYLDEVVRTRDWLVRMVSQIKDDGVPGDIYYSSSW